MLKVKVKHSSPYVGSREIKSVSELLRKGILSTGNVVKRFEEKLTKVVGTRYACAVSSGTSAMFLILKNLPRVFPELRGKSEVIIPSFACFALSNAILMCGLEPSFADISLETYSLCLKEVKRKISRRTLCVIFVHSFGICSDISEILHLGVPIIEDIAQAFGGKVNGKPVGSLGIASFSSFYATKVITTGGEGGAVFSNDKKLIDEIRDFISYDKKIYENRKYRFNFKLTDIGASIGLVQLRRLKEILRRRRKIADVYFENLVELESGDIVKLPQRENNIFFRFPVFLKRGSQRSVIKYLQERGVMAERPIFRPIHYDISKSEKLPNTEEVYRKTVSLPIHPRVSEKEAKMISKMFISSLCRYLKKQAGM